MRRRALVARIAVALLAGGATLLAGAVGSRAQQLEPPARRQGYYAALGVQGAASDVVEQGRRLGRFNGAAVSLSVGELIAGRFGLGLRLEYATLWRELESARVGALSLEGHARVWRHLALQGGVGVGFIWLLPDAAGGALRGGGGASYHAGLTYDWFFRSPRPSGGWALAPSVQLRVMPDGDARSFTCAIGVQIVRWSGLPPNQLADP